MTHDVVQVNILNFAICVGRYQTHLNNLLKNKKKNYVLKYNDKMGQNLKRKTLPHHQRESETRLKKYIRCIFGKQCGVFSRDVNAVLHGPYIGN